MNKTDRKIEEQIKHIKEEHSTMGIGYHLDLLSTLIQEERKDSIMKFAGFLSDHDKSEGSVYWYGGMVEEYLESEGKK